MIGLMRKDFYSVFLYLKQIGVTLFLMLGFSILIKSPSMGSFMIIFLSLSTVQSCLFLDEKNHWDRYALTMPLDRKEMVKARYAVLAVIGILAGVLGALVNVLLCALLHSNEMTDMVVSSFSVYLFYMVVYSISLPFSYRLGADKARYIMVGVMVGAAAVILAVAKMFPGIKNLPDPGTAGILLLGAAAVIFVILCFLVSYRVSLAIYEKKEF